MAYDVQLTNKDGASLCGSDGNFNVDKRLGLPCIRKEVQDYCKRFEANFKHKFDYWTHFKYNGRLYPIY